MFLVAMGYGGGRRPEESRRAIKSLMRSQQNHEAMIPSHDSHDSHDSYGVLHDFPDREGWALRVGIFWDWLGYVSEKALSSVPFLSSFSIRAICAARLKTCPRVPMNIST